MTYLYFKKGDNYLLLHLVVIVVVTAPHAQGFLQTEGAGGFPSVNWRRQAPPEVSDAQRHCQRRGSEVVLMPL